MANVVIRGTTARALVLRPEIRLVEGRMFTPGTSEITWQPASIAWMHCGACSQG